VGTRAFSLGVRQPGHEAGHSPPSSVEVKNMWNCTSTLSYVLMMWFFVKHRNNFILPFYHPFEDHTRSKCVTVFSNTAMHLVYRSSEV